MRFRDPGWRQFGSGIQDGKKSDPGSGINIPDPQPWSVVLSKENAGRFPKAGLFHICCVLTLLILFFSRMKLYLSWCAGSHHFHSKVLLTNLPGYLATVPTKELADKVMSPT